MKTTITITAAEQDVQLNAITIDTSQPDETVKTERAIKLAAGATREIQLDGAMVDFRLRPIVASLRQTGSELPASQPEQPA